MIKVEAPTLEEAYTKASLALECSISELQCEVVQHPSNGILGLFKKEAIIIASHKAQKPQTQEEYLRVPSIEERTAERIVDAVTHKRAEKEPTVKKEPTVEKKIENNEIVDNFFSEKDKTSNKREVKEAEEPVVYTELALQIENQLKELFAQSCFMIDVIEVDVIDDTALIFIDGEDAALLIGKEGYRYNALSYILFNWLHTKYELFIKLEIAEFLTKQHEMISVYLQPVIATIEETGRGKTRPLDGILVQIALEQLRERFPDKYVAVKTAKDGKKFVVINAFNNKSNG